MKQDAFRDQVVIVRGASAGIGKAAVPYNTSYCASKYGMHGFYDALRMELNRHGVSVIMICPYWVVNDDG